jgi:hypothetical protein
MIDESDGQPISEQLVVPVGRVGRMFHTIRLWLGRALV